MGTRLSSRGSRRPPNFERRSANQRIVPHKSGTAGDRVHAGTPDSPLARMGRAAVEPPAKGTVEGLRCAPRATQGFNAMS